MNCQTFQSQMERYSQADLLGDDLKNFELHLVACVSCQKALAQERALEGLLRKHLHAMEAPQDLRESVLASLEKQSSRNFFQNISAVLTKPALIGVAVLIVFSVVLFSSHSSMYAQAVGHHQKILSEVSRRDVSNETLEVALQRLSHELGKNVQRPHLDPAKVQFMMAQTVDMDGHKVAQFIFQKDGQMISAFEVPPDVLEATKIDGQVIFEGDQERVTAKNEKGFEDVLCFHKQTQSGCLFVSNIPRGELIKLMG